MGELGEAEPGDGGGKSGSTARAPGPGEEIDRRRRFLHVSEAHIDMHAWLTSGSGVPSQSPARKHRSTL